jgi:ABC-type Zn uptake system ZnuABC Zn-binding protein ZnuA
MAACSPVPSDSAPRYVATIPPVAAIAREIVGSRGEVITLVPAGASPHTFELKPSDARAASDAKAVIYAAEDLDGWAARLETPESIELFALVSEDRRLVIDDHHDHHDHDGHEHHGEADPHFWTHPSIVAAIAPLIANRLTKIDSEYPDAFRNNASRFIRELDKAATDIRTRLEPFKGRAVVAFHPSMQYLLEREGIEVVGLVAPSPGKETTPQQLRELLDAVKEHDVKAIFTEPQLPKRAAEVLAEEAGVALYELDPLGGVPGRMTYFEWLEYNVSVIEEALQ